jgi:geranylgeranyl pyrophosphate synthase
VALEKTNEEKAKEREDKEHWHRIAATLQEFTRSEGWDRYKNLAEGIERQIIEELVASPKEEHDYLKGYVMGLRKALHLPAEIILRVKG